MKTKDKYIKDKVYNYFIDGLFFNTILAVTMECIIEFLVLGFLNIYTRDYSTNGEVLGMVFAFISIFLSLFLISVLIWSLAFNDETQIASEEFQERWGSIFEFLNSKKKISLSYNLIYILRRIITVVLCVIFD
jgi:hypothetical protein